MVIRVPDFMVELVGLTVTIRSIQSSLFTRAGNSPVAFLNSIARGCENFGGN